MLQRLPSHLKGLNARLPPSLSFFCFLCRATTFPFFLFVQIMPSVHTSQETHYVSATKPNRLMPFREIIAVYCENHTEHVNTLCGQNAEFRSYLTGNTLRLRYKAEPVDAV
jgi:hypothetical protein